MLTEVGALSEYQPTVEKRPRNTFSAEDNIFYTRGQTLSTMAPYSYPAAAGKGYAVADFPNIDKPVETPSGPTNASGRNMSINDLLLFQMAYIPQHDIPLPELSDSTGAPPTKPAESSILHSVTTSTDNSYSTPGSESFIVNEDIASFWSDMPTAFRYFIFLMVHPTC